MPRFALAAAMAVSVLALAPGAQAQNAAPADFTAFNSACAGAQQFLLGNIPEGVDATKILTPLCGCLVTQFKDFSQKDVDILAADLRGEGTEEAHTAHGDYATVEEKARTALNTCFASPEVQAAMPAAPAAPATPAPAAPATPAPAPANPAAPATPAPAPAQ